MSLSLNIVKERVLQKSNNLLLVFLFILGLYLPKENQSVVNCSDSTVSASVVAGGSILFTKVLTCLFNYLITQETDLAFQSRAIAFGLGALLLSVPSSVLNILRGDSYSTSVTIPGNEIFINKVGQYLLFTIGIFFMFYFSPLIGLFPLFTVAGALFFFFISTSESLFFNNISVRRNENEGNSCEQTLCSSFRKEQQENNLAGKSNGLINSMLNILSLGFIYVFFNSMNQVPAM